MGSKRVEVRSASTWVWGTILSCFPRVMHARCGVVMSFPVSDVVCPSRLFDRVQFEIGTNR